MPAYRELRQLTRLQVHFKDIRIMLTNHKEALSISMRRVPLPSNRIDAMLECRSEESAEIRQLHGELCGQLIRR